MRARSIAAVFVAALLVGSLASCSKKDSGSSEDGAADNTEQSATGDDSSAGDAPGSDEASGSGGLADIGSDCFQAKLAFGTMMASTGAFVSGATEEQLRELEDQAAELQDAVPEDLRDDMRVLTDAFDDFATALGRNGIMSDEAQDAAEQMDSDEVDEARANLEEYFDSCE